MTTTSPEQNKALVLEAFDTLFNRRDYVAADASGRTVSSSTVPIFRRAAMGCSILFAAFPTRSAMKIT
jgi:hypothetical protein